MRKLILTLIIISPAVLYGQLDRSVRPKAAPAINIEDSEVFTAANGMTVVLSESHKLPKVSFRLVTGATPELENNLAGLSDIAGSLILSGTSNRTKDKLDSEIDYIGANLRASENSISLSCLTKHMDKGLSVMSDVLLNANFPQTEVDRIIKQNESSLLATKSEPAQMAENAAAKANFPAHPYGEVMTDASLANINRDAIMAYYKRVFTPQASYFVIVGDINREQATEMVEKYFGTWKGGNSNTKSLGTSSSNTANRVIFVKKPGAVQSVVSITFPIDIDPSHADYLKLKVLNGVLGGGSFGNRLMQNLREDKAYTYGCRSSVNVTENGSYFSAGGNFRNDVTDSAIAQILYELERITNDLVEDNEINLTKSSMAGAFARSLENPSTVAQFALSIIKNSLPKDYYQTYLQKLEAVTKDDLLEVARKYLTASNCNIIVVGNEEILDRLLVFDADGRIEKFDAFGNETKEVLPADISKEELISKYISTVTKTSSDKELAKKLKKIKSMQEEFELTMAQLPFPMKMTRFWIAPKVEGQKMEGQGMVFQRSYFDGATGAKISMQTGKEEMTAVEIAAKQKSYGMFPEMNYATSGMEYDLVGIENRDGKDCYVLKLNDGESETYDYFDRSTFYKVATNSIKTVDGETEETTITFGQYEEHDGFIFPMTLQISAGGATFDGKVTSRVLNAKIDINTYK